MVLGLYLGPLDLDKKTGSMLNLALLTALGKAAEIKLHVWGTMNNGLAFDDIKEVLLHATVYCGIPASLGAFKSANETPKEIGKVPESGGARNGAHRSR